MHIANSMLARNRNYLSINELKSIYHAVFSSHLNYASKIWGLSNTKQTGWPKFHIMTRAGFNAHTSTIFKSLGILKVHDQITLLNCLFAHDFLNGKLPKSFVWSNGINV